MLMLYTNFHCCNSSDAVKTLIVSVKRKIKQFNTTLLLVNFIIFKFITSNKYNTKVKTIKVINYKVTI